MSSNIQMRTADDGLYDLLKWLPEKATMLEIGVYTGESTSIFLSSGKIEKIYCIDPWLNGYDDNDIASISSNMSEVEADFRHKFRDDERVVIYKDLSSNTYHKIKDESLDFVYIDGGHTYKHATEDIKNFLPKIKKNGLIGGHDYVQGWPGVVQAVNEILGGPDLMFRDGSWLKKLG